MKITRDFVFQFGKGWNRNQALILGVRWPLEKGWISRLIGKHISREQSEAFVNAATKDKSANQKPLASRYDKTDSPEQFANQLYESCGRDLS